MKFPPILVKLVRQQEIYALIAAILGGVFWANHQPINPWTVILYSLCIGNLLTPAMKGSRGLYFSRPFPSNWVIFLVLLATFTVPVYIISTVIVWWLAPPKPQTLSHLLRTGWNLPCWVILIYGILNFLYANAQDRLENRNLELQREIKANTAQLETQEQDLQRALEIQRALLPGSFPQVVVAALPTR